MKKIIILTILCFPILAKAQEYGNPIYNKIWYAMKIFTGQPGEEKETRFICEEDCSSSEIMYLFKMEFAKTGQVKSTGKFLLQNPTYCLMQGDLLKFWFSDNFEAKPVEYQIIFCDENLLEIEGPKRDRYFFISNVKRSSL